MDVFNIVEIYFRRLPNTSSESLNTVNTQGQTEIYYMCSTHSQTDNENNEANQHNEPRDGIMQCRCGCFFMKAGAVCQNATHGFQLQRSRVVEKQTMRHQKELGVGGGLMNK